MPLSFADSAAPVSAASEGDGQQRAKRDGDTPCDLHIYLLLRRCSHTSLWNAPTWGTLQQLSGDTRLGDNGELKLRRMV
jgi:hypothetical protein